MELTLSTNITGTKPLYYDLELVEGVETITMATAFNVSPNPNFGEEYSVNDIEISLIWYQTNLKNPENDLLTKTVTNKWKKESNYQKEKVLRMDGGKYFNSKKVFYTKKEIEQAKKELIKKQKNKLKEEQGLNLSDNDQLSEIKLAIRIKKLDLFQTKDDQNQEISLYISLFGPFDTQEFKEKNISMIEVGQEVEIDI